ncbi:MAG: hypothetical protein WDA08_00280 [Weeksellaceae bacterium]
MDRFLRNWSLMRVLGILTGGFLFYKGIENWNWLFITLGAIIGLWALLNIRLIKPAEPPNFEEANNVLDTEEVFYEEITADDEI